MSTERTPIPPQRLDHLDLQVKADKSASSFSLLGAGMLGFSLGYPFIDPFTFSPGTPGDTITTAATACALLLRTWDRLGDDAERLKERYEAVKTEQSINQAGGWYVNEHVYQGRRPLEFQWGKLKKGDRFYVIKLPRINTLGDRPPTLQQLAVLYDYIDMTAIHKAHEMMKDKEYSAVALELPNYDGRSQQKKYPAVTREQLMSGKGVKVKHPGRPLRILSPQQFDGFMVSTANTFHQAVTALHDSALSHLVTMAAGAQNEYEFMLAKEMIRRRIDELLEFELEGNYNHPETRMYRDPNTFAFRKEKTRAILTMKERVGRLRLTRFNPSTSETYTAFVDELLHVSKIDPLSVVHSPTTRFRRARLSHIVRDLLPDQLLGAWKVEDPEAKRKALAERMTQNHVYLRPLVKDEANWANRPGVVDRMVKKAPALARLSLPFLLTIAAIRGGGSIAFNETVSRIPPRIDIAVGIMRQFQKLPPETQLAVVDELKQLETFELTQEDILAKLRDLFPLFGGSSGDKEALLNLTLPDKQAPPSANLLGSKTEGAGFLGKVPNPRAEWEIAGSLNPEGYYITSTASQFVEDTWVVTTKPLKTVTLPYELPNATKQLRVHAGFGYSQPTNINFKVPLRNGTTLAALSLRDEHGREIPRTITQLIDGTFLVTIYKEAFNSPPKVEIYATLVESDTAPVFATKPVQQLDVSKLSTKAKNLITVANVLGETPKDRNDVLRHLIQDIYEFSINPPGKEAVETARTPEDYVNAVTELGQCDCAVCNSLEVLASTQTGDGTHFLNMAFGYMSFERGTGGRGGGFLRNESAHGFAITNEGEIFDATAHNVAQDKTTQDYIRLLSGERISEENSTPVPVVTATPSQTAVVEAMREINTPTPAPTETTTPASDSTPTPFPTPDDNPVLTHFASGESEPTTPIEPSTPILPALVGVALAAFAAWKTPRLKSTPPLSNTTPSVESLFNAKVFENFPPEEIKRLVNFLIWVSYGNLNSPVKLSLSIKYEDDPVKSYEYLSRNVNPARLAQYMENPSVLEQHYNLSEAEVNYLRVLARDIGSRFRFT